MSCVSSDFRSTVTDLLLRPCIPPQRCAVKESGQNLGLRGESHTAIPLPFHDASARLGWDAKCPRRQVPVEVGDPHQRQEVCPFVGPSHLALLGHARAHHLIDRRLSDAAADRQSLSIARAIVDQESLMRSHVAACFAHIPPQCGKFLVRPFFEFVVDRLQARYRLATLAVPDQPLGAFDLALDPFPIRR